jgi:nucleotide-binding universal stress UspA family protein
VMPSLAGNPELSDEMAIGQAQADYLEAAANRVRDAGVSHVSTKLLRSDHIVEALEAHRVEVGASLTVMCTHGRGAIERAWLGSVADRLVRASDAPVLLVRAASDEGHGSGMDTHVRFDRVLVPLDGSHLSRQALDAATELAGNSDSTVYILARVIESPHSLGSWWLPAAMDRTPEQIEKARALAEAKLDLEVQSFARDGYKVEAVAEFAAPVAKGILDLADSRKADVIVIATHGRSGIGRLMLGSVADKVIRAADRPVLVVRPTE